MDEQKREGWEAAARRTQFSEKVELTTLPGYWIRARKFPVKGNDEIEQIKLKKGKCIPKAMASAFRKFAREGGNFEEFEKTLTDDEILEIANQPEMKISADILEAHLKWGIGEHNLDQEAGASTGSQDLIERIMSFPAVAEEINKIIMGWNSPLASATDGK